MRLLLYLAFIVGFATIGIIFVPVLGYLGAAAGWLSCAILLWLYDHATGGEPWGFMDWIFGTYLRMDGSISDFNGFDGWCDGGGGD